LWKYNHRNEIAPFMSTATPAFRLGSVALPVYLPSLLFSTGEGAIIPVIPVAADRLGASLALAGLIAALLPVGQALGDIPSGPIVAKVGERNAMFGAAAVAVLGVVLCLIAPGPWLLAVGAVVIGLATSSFALARQAFMTTFVPLSHRARALSTLGGMFRAGYFIGPFIAAGVIQLTGSVQSAFWIQIAGAGLASLVLVLLPDPAEALAQRRQVLRATPSGAASTSSIPTFGSAPVVDETEVGGEPPRIGLFKTIVQFRKVLARMGTGVAIVGGLRTSRQVILPLVALSLGMQESSIALVIGIAGAVDFAFFYTSGQIMDHFGRMWSIIPSLLGLSLGHLALSVAHGLPDAIGWFIGIAMFMSVANGIGSGIVMTLGADLAPRGNPAPFLGAFRFTGDAGNAAAPLLVSAITGLAGVAVAAAGIGVIGIVGAGLLARWVPRFVPTVKRRTAAAR
jgi:MFS family permease